MIRKGPETVLLVDDVDTILEVGKEILETLGYDVLVAGNGKEAIEIYENHREKIDLIILDIVMPGMGGAETCARLQEINPDIRVLLSSGYSVDDQAIELLKRGCNGFIRKPFTIEKLSHKIREILDT
jgi:two-component system cell cycle sensor histidine kinase/response regulator CckA